MFARGLAGSHNDWMLQTTRNLIRRVEGNLDVEIPMGTRNDGLEKVARER